MLPKGQNRYSSCIRKGNQINVASGNEGFSSWLLLNSSTFSEDSMRFVKRARRAASSLP
jgi:hypothetical protein